MNEKLRAARKLQDKTQEQVAQEAGVTGRAYQSYEYGKREPGVRTAIRIADSVGVKSLERFKEIFGGDLVVGRKCGRDAEGIFHCYCGKCRPAKKITTKG